MLNNRRGPRMARSTVVSVDSGSISEVRTSFSTYLQRNEHPVETCLEHRAASLVQTDVWNVEPLQVHLAASGAILLYRIIIKVVWYREGQQYEAHHDYFSIDDVGSLQELKRGGQREITIFGYLNTLEDDEGGETYFPELNITLTPKKGDALMWYNVDPRGEEDPRTLHGGAPVKKGAEKWGTNIWIRLSAFH